MSKTSATESMQRRRGMWVAAGGACAVLIAVGVGLALRQGPSAPQETVPPKTAPAEATAPAPSSAQPAAPPDKAQPSTPGLQVMLTTQPLGATVRLRGKVMGVTPLVVELPEGGKGPWHFSLAGHEPKILETLPVGGLVHVDLKKLPGAPPPRPSPANANNPVQQPQAPPLLRKR
jgi:hypothetical protein